MDKIDIQPMQPSDYAEAVALWQSVEGVYVHLDDADSEPAIRAYLQFNEGMSFVARTMEKGRLVGTLLCGVDGRRGYLQHLAVTETHRGRGIARRLVEAVVAVLRERGYTRCHIMVITGNDGAREFWKRVGFRLNDTVRLMSRDIGPSDGNA